MSTAEGEVWFYENQWLPKWRLIWHKVDMRCSHFGIQSEMRYTESVITFYYTEVFSFVTKWQIRTPKTRTPWERVSTNSYLAYEDNFIIQNKIFQSLHYNFYKVKFFHNNKVLRSFIHLNMYCDISYSHSNNENKLSDVFVKNKLKIT